MGFSRRSIYDLNRCEFQGRVVGTIEMSEVQKQDKSWVTRCDFTLACNSNPFNSRSVYWVHCYAFGHMAQAINVKIEKGCKVFCIAEYKPVTIKANKKNGTAQSTKPLFEVKHIVLEAYPARNQEAEELNSDDYETGDAITGKE